MTKLRELYYCKHCKNLVEITAEGATALVCCGEDMELLEAKTADQGKTGRETCSGEQRHGYTQGTGINLRL